MSGEKSDLTAKAMNNLAEKLKQVWEYIQDILDVRGDVVMMVMSSAFIFRIVWAGWNSHPGLNASEAALYTSAIASFAYSNKGPKV